MRGSVVSLVSAISTQLLRFPALVDNLERKDPEGITKLLAWIRQSEDMLREHQIPEVAELAGLRSRIITPTFSEAGRSDRRRGQVKAAFEVMYDLQNVLQEILNPRRVKIEAARELIRQLLAIIIQAKAVSFNPRLPFEKFLDKVWAFILSNEKLSAGAVKLKTEMNTPDILVLLAGEIRTEDFPVFQETGKR